MHRNAQPSQAAPSAAEPRHATHGIDSVTRRDRIVEEGFALFCADGPNAGKIAECYDGNIWARELSMLTPYVRPCHKIQSEIRDEALKDNHCTAFRVGKYKITEVAE